MPVFEPLVARVAIVVLTLLAISSTMGCIENERPLLWTDSPTAILKVDPFPNLVVEVDYVEGREPSDFALGTLKDTLRSVTAKRNVSILPPTVIPEWDPNSPIPWRESDATHRAEDTFVVHVLYLNGCSPAGDGACALGKSWSRMGVPAIAVFMDEIEKVVTQDPRVGLTEGGREMVERAVLVHEMGHLMGLVNEGIPMQHAREDGEHPGHSTNKESVMYFSTDNRMGLAEYLVDNEFVPYRFDVYDLEDLRTFREGTTSSENV